MNGMMNLKNTMSEPNDSETMALATITPPAEPPAVVDKCPNAITPAQARIEAVAHLLHGAYEKASTLKLTPEESTALLRPFPDTDFRTGAGGKENLIYIEHAALRERLNSVFGLGQWSLVARNRWGEDYEYFDQREHAKKKACRVYVEAVLVVRGCFVAEAIGDMVYYPANQQTNYGDAVEGAKSAALRRCAKELGVGLQAWRKDFCESWMAKHAGKRPLPAQEAAPSKPVPAPTKPAPPTETAEQRKGRWLAMCKDAAGGQDGYVVEVFVEAGWIMDNEGPEAISDTYVPKTKKEADKILAEIRKRAGVGEPPPEADAPWRSFPVPFGKNAGTPLGNLPKNTLFGFWANFEVTTEYNGHPKSESQIEKDEEFRAALDAAGEHYQFEKPEDKQ